MKTALIYAGGIVAMYLVLLSIYVMLKKLLKEWKETEKANSNDPHDLFYH